MTKAMEVVAQAINVVIETDSVDIIASAIQVIKSNLSPIKSSITEATRKLAEIKKRRGALKHNETLYDANAFDLVASIFDNKIKQYEQTIAANQDGLKVIEEAVAMLNGISCQLESESSATVESMLQRYARQSSPQFFGAQRWSV